MKLPGLGIGVVICGILAMCILQGCRRQAKDPLTENRSKWAAIGIKSYRFTLQIDCYCPLATVSPLEITVKNGQAVTVRETRKRRFPEHYTVERIADYSTVERLFDTVERQRRRAGASMAVTYDSERGFPSRFESGRNIPDGQLVCTITNLTPLDTATNRKK